jgi:S-methylmethionine-dependent homocysteine/selenocysteine methylase
MDPICNNLASWIELGAKYVGGCCNVGSKDINKMKITLSTN